MENIYSGELTAPKDGLNISIWDRERKLSWNSNQYLIIVLESKEDHTLTFNVDFYKNGQSKEYALRITFSILPHITSTVPIDLELLNSQTLIVPRTKGRLRMMVYGKPLLREEITGIKLTTLKCFKEQKISVKQLYLTNDIPQLSLPEKKLMDEMGQWMMKGWDSKLYSTEECSDMLRHKLIQAEVQETTYEEGEWDVYGGWKKKQFDKTGWFHTVRDDKRFWLADPEGNAFLSLGIDCIRPGNDIPVDQVREFCSWLPEKKDVEFADAWTDNERSFNFGIANLVRAFGREKWKESFFKITKAYLNQWHINTIANWSSMEFIKYAKIPYVLPLDAQGKGFPTTTALVFRDFPNVFSPEYGQNAKEYAKSILPFRDDKYLIGYFMRNEPAWGFVHNLLIAEEMLASKERLESRNCFITRIKVKYKTIENFNLAWNLSLKNFEKLCEPLYHASDLSMDAREDLKEFSKEMITQYVKIPAQEIKKLDSNHLNLGMRYAFITDPIMLSGYEFFDVFSINLYQMSPFDEVQAMGKILDMPIMLGEFHFGALDKGLVSSGLRCVPDQKERGKAYRYYLEQGMRSKYFLGAHYFQFCDQNCLGRFDGENYQIGITDVLLQEYQDMTEIMKECHKYIYEVADGQRYAYELAAVELPAVHC
jgi:hypothetical protein